MIKLSLIGMSGSGKSYWSSKLADQGFDRICCDDLIAKKLVGDLTRSDSTVMDVGEWMGFPYEPYYKARAAQYLACEREVLTEILERYIDTKNNLVIDTTGSAIYTGADLMKKLGESTRIVHLSTPADVREQMLGRYLTNHRPVLWNGMYQKKPHETNEQALARCYPKLLTSREQQYTQYADITIDFHIRHQEDFGVTEFLDLVQAGLEAFERSP